MPTTKMETTVGAVLFNGLEVDVDTTTLAPACPALLSKVVVDDFVVAVVSSSGYELWPRVGAPLSPWSGCEMRTPSRPGGYLALAEQRGDGRWRENADDEKDQQLDQREP